MILCYHEWVCVCDYVKSVSVFSVNPPVCWLWCDPQKYEHELFKLALPCLSAVAGALPPDYMESNYVAMMEKQSSMDAEGNFNPQPVDTSKSVYMSLKNFCS